jgi:Cys/Met metabolism PLP-dependent enzyme
MSGQSVGGQGESGRGARADGIRGSGGGGMSGTGQARPSGFETLAIHAGQEPDPATGAVVPPIYQVSTYAQDGVGGLRGGYEYSRTANPTRTALEECLIALEGGARALVFASGMAAEDCCAPSAAPAITSSSRTTPTAGPTGCSTRSWRPGR